MSRALILLCLCLLTACVQQPRPYMPVITSHPGDAAFNWLQLQNEVLQLSSEEAVAYLVDLNRPENDDELYHYALLNQQVDTFGGWTQARDALQTLLQSSALLPGQQQLVQLLLEYSQSQINYRAKLATLRDQQKQLTQKLSTAQEEKALLEQKIQALTDLEADISTRREE